MHVVAASRRARKGPALLVSSAGTRARPRTCVGCRQTAPRGELLRVFVTPAGELVPDVAGGGDGRGAWVHPTLGCLRAAPRGMGRALGVPEPGWAAFAGHLQAVAGRRVEGLLSAALRSRRAVAGADLCEAALARGAPLLVVARDARSAAELGWVRDAVAAGRALAWGSKEALGRLSRHGETALVAVEEEGLAKAVRRAAELQALGLTLAGGLEVSREDG